MRNVRNPDTQGHADAGTVAPKSMAPHHPPDALQSLKCPVKGGVVQQNGKFLYTVSCCKIPRAQTARYEVANAFQNLVSRLMAVGVVDLLEVVDIKKSTGQWMLIPAGTSKLQVQRLSEVAVIAEPCQTIPIGQILQSTRGLPLATI